MLDTAPPGYIETEWPYFDSVATYGSWAGPWLYSDINNSGFGVVLSARRPVGGITEDHTASVDQITIGVSYTEGPEEDRVCFATRSIEIRSNGVDRQAPEDDVWGGLVPDGFFPAAIPSGPEGRPSRVIVIPSQGDLGTLADAGSNKLSAAVNVRTGHHAAREK